MRKRTARTLVTLFAAAAAAMLLSLAASAATNYDLWVAGTQVTSDTLSGEGWSFEPDTNTLVLNGFSYGSGGYGYRLGYDTETWTDIYAFIYVTNVNRQSKMNLNIRLEGRENHIGDPYLSGYTAVSAGGDYYSTYYGIYNPYGDVNITGSARLNIYTNQLGIFANNLNLDGCTGGIYMGAYSACIDSYRLNLKNGSKLNAYCGFGGGRRCNTPIHVEKTVNIFDTCELYSEIERYEKTDDYGISGIFCEDTINVYGGKLTGISHAQGKTPNVSRPACFGIQAKTLNISGGAVVEALVKQGSGQKSYLRSTGVGYYYAGNGTINFKGNGVLRAGVQKKNPDGTQTLLPGTITCGDLDLQTTSTAKDGYESFVEMTAYDKENAYVKNGSLSYYRDFRKTVGYPAWDGDLPPSFSKIIPAGSGLAFYVLGGEHTFEPNLSDGTVPEIRVESGKLTLQLRGGKTYVMKGSVTLYAGTELVISGDGILTGLNVQGSGKITFTGGTVADGKIAKNTEVIVTGGNINAAYDGTAKDGNGRTVSMTEYTLTDAKAFSRVDLVALRSRDYGNVGLYPIDGKSLYLWTISEGEVLYVRATKSDGKEVLTLSSVAGNPTLLDEGVGIKTASVPVYVIRDGWEVTLDPFAVAPTAEQMQDYELVWSYSNYGDDLWYPLENAAELSDSLGKLTLTSSSRPRWSDNLYMRCEIYRKSSGALAGVYSTLIHVFNPLLMRTGDWIEGEETTFTLTEYHPVPEGLVKWSVNGWDVSKDGGKKYTSVGGASGFSYTFTVTEEMEGWVYRCSSSMEDSNGLGSSDGVKITIPTLFRKTVKLDKQPENGLVLDLDDPDASVTLTVEARNVKDYQWQVSKRKSADQTEEPFEDIIDANEASFTLTSADADDSMLYYAYRCVMTNDVNRVVSDEVSFDYKKLPYIVEVPDVNSITLYEEDKETFAVTVHPGLPQARMHVYWEVSTDGGENYTFVWVQSLLNGKTKEVTAEVTPEGQAVTCNQYRLEIVNADKVMNGFMFRCKYSLDSGQPYLTTEPITLTVTDKCSQNGHTGGTATCYQRAICEECGTAYGEVDPENHTGTAEWDTRYWNIANTHWKTWSCCKKQIEEAVHTFEDGVCTVCGCVCDHALKKKANCHEEGECYICGVKTDDIDPDNHDLSLGTTTSGEKDPTCTEDGYTGDTVCWKCLNVISTGAVIPAKGHDTTWEATCREPAYCIVCREYYGEKAPDNHYEPWSAYYINATETTHEEHWNCCDMVTVLPHKLDEEGVCTLCHYGCQHTGGTANCVEPAHCEKCGEPYGDLDPDNHEYTMILPNEDDTHTEYCKCGKIISGPEAHIWEDGFCTKCYAGHFDHTESDWIVEELPAFGKFGLRCKYCTICHMLLDTETIDAVEFDTVTVGHNCSFGNDLSMLYAIPKSELESCTDIRLIVEKEHYDGNTLGEAVTKTLYPEEITINGETYYRFDYKGVSAKEMGDTLTAELAFFREGANYSGKVDIYSLKAYAMERLSASQDAFFNTLLVDLLNYGAAAQTYFAYRTDALVNSDLTDEQKALATKDYGALNVVENTGDGTEYPASIIGQNVLFDNRIKLLIATDFGEDSDLDGVSLRIRYKDYRGRDTEKLISGADFTYRTDVNGYTACFGELKASELRTELEFTLVKNGAEISATVKYSFDTYASNRLSNSEDVNFKELLEKTLFYSDSAKDYFA